MKRQVVIPAPRGVPATAPEASFVPTVLDVKQARERSARLVDATRNRLVCRFWTEKLLVLIDALQIYALLWQLSQPWPWPARWLAWTRWVNAFNGDAFSFRSRGAAMGATAQSFSLWGEMRHYWLYALGFAVAPLVLVAGLQLAIVRWEASGRGDFLVRRVAWTNALVHLLYVMYLPVGLAVARLLNCDEAGSVSVDPETFPACWSMPHILVVAVVTCGVGGGFLIGFPWWLRRTISRAVFTTDEADHERFLQSTELAYVLGLSDTYMDLYGPQFASFRAHAVHCFADMCVVKLVLLVVFSLLRSQPPSTANQGLQGTMFFSVFVLIAWKQSWWPRFRAHTTNQLAKILAWQLVANGVIALLCANGVRSALTVSTSVTSSLTFLNLVALSLVAVSLGRATYLWYHRTDLLPLPGAVLLSRHACWPTHPLMEEIVSEQVALEEWVKLVRDVRSLSLQTVLAAPTMKPFHVLVAKAQELDTAWRQAKTCDHPLAVHLHHELLLLTDLYVDALATSPFKDTSLQADHEEAFSVLADRLQRRSDEQRLIPAGNRHVLSKLQALSAWSTTEHEKQTM